MSSFIDDLIAGRALLSDADDYITAWHDAPESEVGTQELHEFLGMSWEEYQLFGERPEALRFIVAARKNDEPVAKVLSDASQFRLAARTSDASEAEKLFQWLVERGRVSA